MQLGMIGLGRMGANMLRRLMRVGHQCVVHDRNSESVAALVKEGAVGSSSVDDFVSKLKPPQAAWLMVPAAFVDSTFGDLAARLAKFDIATDAGNSYYIDDLRRFQRFEPRGIHYVDVGTGGGVWGRVRLDVTFSFTTPRRFNRRTGRIACAN
jgi:6-phosphogluconate dehydrogenase